MTIANIGQIRDDSVIYVLYITGQYVNTIVSERDTSNAMVFFCDVGYFEYTVSPPPIIVEHGLRGEMIQLERFDWGLNSQLLAKHYTTCVTFDRDLLMILLKWTILSLGFFSKSLNGNIILSNMTTVI